MSQAMPFRVDAEVLANRSEGGTNRRLILGVGERVHFEPGQFLMLSPGATGAAVRHDPLLPRPMAIYRADHDSLEVLYKVHGRGTALLADASPGERVRLVGPLGRAFPLPEPGSTALLVGGGTGIASLFDLAARAAREARVVVLLGAGSASDLMGVTDFEKLDLELCLATEDGSAGHAGLVTELLTPRLPEADRVYACGPTPMMRAVAEIAAAQGTRCVVSLESTMACGFGVCLGCAVPRAGAQRAADERSQNAGFSLVCRDGPVFDAADVDWTGLP